MKTLKEELAALCHSQWSGWMEYLFNNSDELADGTVSIPVGLVLRWKRQIETKYEDLSEAEQNSDRKEADKFIEVFDRLYQTRALQSAEEDLEQRQKDYERRVEYDKTVLEGQQKWLDCTQRELEDVKKHRELALQNHKDYMEKCDKMIEAILCTKSKPNTKSEYCPACKQKANWILKIVSLGDDSTKAVNYHVCQSCGFSVL